MNAVNNRQETALHLASRSGNVNIFKILVEAGADVNAVNNRQDTQCILLHNVVMLTSLRFSLKQELM